MKTRLAVKFSLVSSSLRKLRQRSASIELCCNFASLTSHNGETESIYFLPTGLDGDDLMNEFLQGLSRAVGHLEKSTSCTRRCGVDVRTYVPTYLVTGVCWLDSGGGLPYGPGQGIAGQAPCFHVSAPKPISPGFGFACQLFYDSLENEDARISRDWKQLLFAVTLCIHPPLTRSHQ